MYLDYSNYIEQIKEALKIKRRLECFEEMDLKNILKEITRESYELSYDGGKRDSENDNDAWY